MSERDDLAESIARLADVLIDQLKKQTTYRGARMQVMRERLVELGAWHQFLHERPEVRDWFDSDGVPK